MNEDKGELIFMTDYGFFSHDSRKTPSPKESKKLYTKLTQAEQEDLHKKLLEHEEKQYQDLQKMVNSTELNEFHKRNREALKVWEVSHADTYKPRKKFQ